MTTHPIAFLYLIVAAITWGYITHKWRYRPLIELLLLCFLFSLFWPVFWLLELGGYKEAKP